MGEALNEDVSADGEQLRENLIKILNYYWIILKRDQISISSLFVDFIYGV